MKPFMPEAETQLFMKYLTINKNKFFYEFGSGGSTYFACTLPHIELIHSMESDTAFYNTMLTKSVIQEAIQSKKLIYIY